MRKNIESTEYKRKGVADFRDIEIGNRLRLARMTSGLSQVEVAEHFGLSFQQIQKNESGANRVPANRIPELCKIYDRPYSFFLDNLEAPIQDNHELLESKNIGADWTDGVDACLQRYSKLISIFEKFPDQETKKQALNMLRIMARIVSDRTE